MCRRYASSPIHLRYLFSRVHTQYPRRERRYVNIGRGGKQDTCVRDEFVGSRRRSVCLFVRVVEAACAHIYIYGDRYISICLQSIDSHISLEMEMASFVFKICEIRSHVYVFIIIHVCGTGNCCLGTFVSAPVDPCVCRYFARVKRITIRKIKGLTIKIPTLFAPLIVPSKSPGAYFIYL